MFLLQKKLHLLMKQQLQLLLLLKHLLMLKKQLRLTVKK